ncbi:MAG: LysR substrate-binding domain-containing protein, partial [Gemmatimonadota bacterium]
GVGVSILPASVEKLGWKNVRYRPVGGRATDTRISAAWRRDRARPVVHAFMGVVRQVVRGEKS